MVKLRNAVYLIFFVVNNNIFLARYIQVIARGQFVIGFLRFSVS